ncbi:MAG TPA: hypothetical protein PLO06_11415, partial [Methanoregulaceae archaeon]|nr:hypothetical protein [Methanoregulaceae archaeon]
MDSPAAEVWGTWGTSPSFFRDIFHRKKDKKSPGNRVECAPCAPGKQSPSSGLPVYPFKETLCRSDDDLGKHERLLSSPSMYTDPP